MIVYYTGTGNSRYCAQALAVWLGDEAVDAFCFLRDGGPAALRSERPWVFITPTHAWQIPRVFADFLRVGSFSGSRDAYFVMSCGSEIGNAGAVNRALCAEKGFAYRGSLAVVMPENYVALFAVPGAEEARAIVGAARPALESAAACIRDGRPFPGQRAGAADRMKSGIVNAAFYRFVVGARRFTVSDACVGCGKCARDCVRSNIKLRDGRPVWGDRCIHCMACICGCPASAVEYGRRSVGKPRYQCPPYEDEVDGRR